MKAWVIFIVNGLILVEATAQDYNSSSIFAHNDYAQKNPFYDAYQFRVGYIEADVFLKDNQLFVAHHQKEIKKDRTLEEMYLNPLKKEISKNKGWAYPDTTLSLKLMIDIKTEGISTLKKLEDQLNLFPELITAKGFEIFISGNVPLPDRWKEFSNFIHFDGRPGIRYTQDQLNRITLISTSFSLYSKWNGKGELPAAENNKLDSLMDTVHTMGKQIRFWAAPDYENGWKKLMGLKVDVIGSDNVPQLIQFILNTTAEKSK